MKLSAKYSRWLHVGMCLFWIACIVPTWVWWYDSVLWVSFLSLYANFATHWGAYQAVRAEETNNEPS